MAEKMKEMSAAGTLSEERIEEILLDRKQIIKNVSIPAKTIQKYFSEEYSAEDIEKKIIELLEEWKREHNHG